MIYDDIKSDPAFPLPPARLEPTPLPSFADVVVDEVSTE